MKVTLIKFLLGAEEKTIQTVFSHLRANGLDWRYNPTFKAFIVVEEGLPPRVCQAVSQELKGWLATQQCVHLQETEIAA